MVALVCSWSLLIRWAQRARQQAETPFIPLSKFPGSALSSPSCAVRATLLKWDTLEWSLRIECNGDNLNLDIGGSVTCGLGRNIFLYGSKEAA